MLRNLVKERLQAGKPAIGLGLPFVAPALVEIIGYAGFHWVLIDCEHGPMNLETAEAMIRAAQWAGITPIVRPVRNEAPTILHYLDMGAQGVYIPRVETKADAEAGVRAARYYPEGMRGLAGYARWARCGVEGLLPQLMKEANENTLVVALIETAKGVENVDEVASVLGVDIVAVGPADLSQSMGLPGEANHPRVVEAAEHVLDRTLAAGKVPCFGANNADEARDLIARGVLCLTYSAQTLALSAGREFLKAAGVK